MYDEYLQKWGLNEIHKKHLEVLRKKALLELDYVITKDRTKLTLIEIEEIKLKNVLNSAGKGMSVEQALLYIGKWLGSRVPIKEITADEYFIMLNEFGKIK